LKNFFGTGGSDKSAIGIEKYTRKKNDNQPQTYQHRESQLKQYLENNGIRPILARVKHLQINGKIEKWFHI
jgi:transposase InsO family protein